MKKLLYFTLFCTTLLFAACENNEPNQPPVDSPSTPETPVNPDEPANPNSPNNPNDQINQIIKRQLFLKKFLSQCHFRFLLPNK